MTYIILGAILATIGLSFLTGLAEVITVAFEYVKCRIAISIAKYNAQIAELAEPQQDSATRAIGFTISKEEDDIDDE